jgi:IS5 family transposase
MIVLKQWHGLSDFELEKQYIDPISCKKFLGFPEYIPYNTRIFSFIKIIIGNCKGINLETVKKPT